MDHPIHYIQKEESRAFKIINKTNFLEKEISMLIQRAFQPQCRQNEFGDFLLNSDVLPLGKKISLLRLMKLISKKYFNDSMNLISYRNKIAHSILSSGAHPSKINKRGA